MSVGEPNDCICGRTTSGGGGCSIHPIPFDEKLGQGFKLDNIRPFVSPEQEAEFRVLYRNHYKQFGYKGMFLCLGEMLSCVKILNEVMLDVIDEEKKKFKKEKD